MILAVALALAGAVAWRMSVTTGHEAAPSGIESVPAATRAEVRASGRTEEQSQNQRDTNTAPMAGVQANDRTPDVATTEAKEPIDTRAEKQTTPPAAGIDSSASSVDESVVGQPFPVSQSILAACEKYTRRSECEPNRALLVKMAEEPREEPWASSAERAIRALVELEPGTDRPRAITHMIRNLECRKTICFVETASQMERFHTQFFHFEQDNRLRAGYSSISTETQADGIEVHVTLLPIQRVPLSTRELSERRRRDSR